MDFAFYGRVSTEDQQDPVASRHWQMSRAQALIEPVGGRVVREYFDIGQSRSVPWPRRPEASRLLADLEDPNRGFEAVVIGEPQRAFSGSQFAMTFPLFEHFGVGLWVHEIGGEIDPQSEGHDIVMSTFGGLAKAETSRIKQRVRASMGSQVRREGRFQGGRPPYGYRLADAGPHPNPSKAAEGRRLHRLEPDPLVAPVVRRIFNEYISGRGFGAIAEGLNRDGILSPSGHDPVRNRHRSSAGGAWGKPAVRAILGNPRYTGRQVWNRQRRKEVLRDVKDVAAGYATKMVWNERDAWIVSDEPSHEAIISEDVFVAATAQRLSSGKRGAVVKPRRRNVYLLTSLLRCGICGRRMSGSWNHGAAHYRCGYPSEYAGAAGKHPQYVYVREDDITNCLDPMLADWFSAANLDATVDALMAAQNQTDAVDAHVAAARERVARCEERIQRHLDALEAGADAPTIAQRINAIQAERAVAQRVIEGHRPRSELSRTDLHSLLTGVSDWVAALDRLTPGEKQELYGELGLTLTYEPEWRLVAVESRPKRCTQVSVGGGT